MEPITQDTLQAMYKATITERNEIQTNEWTALEPQLRAYFSECIRLFELKPRKNIHEELHNAIQNLLKDKYSAGEILIKLCNNKVKHILSIQSIPYTNEFELLHGKSIDILLHRLVTQHWDSWRKNHFPAAKFVVRTVHTNERIVFLQFKIQ